MDAAHLEQIKQALTEIPHLRSLRYGNQEFKYWKDKVARILEEAYGKGSVEANRFINAPGTTFPMRTESGLNQDYQYRLDSCEEVLQGLIQGQ